MINKYKTSCLLIIAIFLANCSSPKEEFLGYYEGLMNHNNQPFTMGMEFKQDTSGLKAIVTFPEYGWSFPINDLIFEDSVIRSGLFTMTIDHQRMAVSGIIPSGMAPRYEIEFNLFKTDQKAAFMENKWISSSKQPDFVHDLKEKIWGGIVEADGALIIGTLDGNLHSLNTKDFSVNWTFECGGEIRGTALTENGYSYVYSDNGQLHKVSPRGEGIWSFSAEIDSVERQVANYDLYSGTPLLDNGVIYFGNGSGNVYAINEIDGKEVKRFNAGGPVRETPVLDGNDLVFSGFGGSVQRIDLESENVIFNYDAGSAVTSGPVLYHDKIIFGDRNYDVTAIDKSNGAVLWKYYYWFSWVESTPVVYKDRIYVGSSDSQMFNVLDADNGNLIWKFDTGGSPWSSPLVTEDYVFIATIGTESYFTNHYAYLICLNRASGKEEWRFSLEPESEGHYGFASSPALIDGRVFIGDTSGKIYAFSL